MTENTKVALRTKFLGEDNISEYLKKGGDLASTGEGELGRHAKGIGYLVNPSVPKLKRQSKYGF